MGCVSPQYLKQKKTMKSDFKLVFKTNNKRDMLTLSITLCKWVMDRRYNGVDWFKRNNVIYIDTQGYQAIYNWLVNYRIRNNVFDIVER